MFFFSIPEYKIYFWMTKIINRNGLKNKKSTFLTNGEVLKHSQKIQRLLYKIRLSIIERGQNLLYWAK